MTLEKLVKRMREAGVKINTRRRADGGIVVTKINNETFKGKMGNAALRTMGDQPLSRRQLAQRSLGRQKWIDTQIKAKSSKSEYKVTGIKGQKVPKKLRSLITKTNKALRGSKVKYRISTRLVKAALRRGESLSSIRGRLLETMKHAEGTAYSKEATTWASYFRAKGRGRFACLIEKLSDAGKLTSSDTAFIRQTDYGKGSKQEKISAILDRFVAQKYISASRINYYMG